jgi:hypothetical protein
VPVDPNQPDDEEDDIGKRCQRDPLSCFGAPPIGVPSEQALAIDQAAIAEQAQLDQPIVGTMFQVTVSGFGTLGITANQAEDDDEQSTTSQGPSSGGAGGGGGGGGDEIARRIRKHVKNSNKYEGETLVYKITTRTKSGQKTYKFGESSQGVRVRDGKSIRAEQQVRKIFRTTGQTARSRIVARFKDKASARAFERRIIRRMRETFGDDALPGNKNGR